MNRDMPRDVIRDLTRLMPSSRKLLVQLAAAAVWLTGLAWLILHYWFSVQGEYGPEANPAEPWMLRAHGAAAFLSLWVFGLLWGLHILPAWSRHQRRWTGSALTAAALVLILTGYLLYYVGDENLRTDTSIVHWMLGILALLAFLAHGLRRRDTSNQE